MPDPGHFLLHDLVIYISKDISTFNLNIHHESAMVPHILNIYHGFSPYIMNGQRLNTDIATKAKSILNEA